jgi:hypothetical protein
MISIVVDHSNATAQEQAAFKKASPVMDFIKKSRNLGFSVNLTFIQKPENEASLDKIRTAALHAAELAYETNLTSLSMKAALNNLTQVDIQSAKLILSKMQLREVAALTEQRDYIVSNGWKPTIPL